MAAARAKTLISSASWTPEDDLLDPDDLATDWDEDSWLISAPEAASPEVSSKKTALSIDHTASLVSVFLPSLPPLHGLSSNSSFQLLPEVPIIHSLSSDTSHQLLPSFPSSSMLPDIPTLPSLTSPRILPDKNTPTRPSLPSMSFHPLDTLMSNPTSFLSIASLPCLSLLPSDSPGLLPPSTHPLLFTELHSPPLVVRTLHPQLSSTPSSKSKTAAAPQSMEIPLVMQLSPVVGTEGTETPPPSTQDITRDLECGSQLNTTRPAVPQEGLNCTHSMEPSRQEVADSIKVIASEEPNSTQTLTSDCLETDLTRTLETTEVTQELNKSNPKVNLSLSHSLNRPGLEMNRPQGARLPPSKASSQPNTNSTVSQSNIESQELNSTFNRFVKSQDGASANIGNSVPEDSSTDLGGTFDVTNIQIQRPSPSIPAPGELLIPQDESVGVQNVTQSPKHSLAPRNSNTQAPRNIPNMVQSPLPKNRPNMGQSRVQSPSSRETSRTSRPSSSLQARLSLLQPFPVLLRPPGRPSSGICSGVPRPSLLARPVSRIPVPGHKSR